MVRKMRMLILLYGFLLIEMFGIGVYAKDEVELAKLRDFLSQESAVTGVMNYEQLGIDSLEDIIWTAVPGLYWSYLTDRLERVYWAGMKLSGHLDFSDFASLEYVYCSHNDIKSINVTNAVRLKKLDIYTNDIDEIDLTTNPLLTYFRSGYNHIAAIDFSNNPNISFLCCRSNQLDMLDVSDKEYLTELYCGSNHIHTLNLDNCTALEILSCDYNHLETFSLNNLPQLKTVSCSNNGMQDLYYYNCIALEELDCHNNELTSIEPSDFANLTKLNCNNNKLTSINLEGCDSLTSLFCDNNILFELDISFTPLLSKLSCKNNYFTFSTIPVPTEIMTSYSYTPQADIIMDCKYDDIDFSEYYRVNDVVSRYVWYYKNTTIAPLESNEGRFAFDETYIGEQFICRMQNSLLPYLTMRYFVTLTEEDMTNNAKSLKNKPVIYASDQSIHVTTGSPLVVSVYSLQGMLKMKKTVEAGHTVLPVERGAYVVVTDDKSSYKVLVR